MQRMSMSRLQNLSPNWRQRHHEQPLGIPGHKRPSLPHRRWNWKPSWCLSRKCSSSKLQPVPGQRESDMEVGWNLFQKGYNSIIAKYLNKSGRPMSNSVQTTCGKNCPENQQMHILKISVRQQYLELFSKCHTGWNVAWEQRTNLCRFDWHKRKNAAELPQVVVQKLAEALGENWIEKWYKVHQVPFQKGARCHLAPQHRKPAWRRTGASKGRLPGTWSALSCWACHKTQR